MKSKTLLSIAISSALLLGTSTSAFAAKDNPNNEQGSTNGQPFKTIRSHIEMISVDFQATVDDLQAQIDAAKTDLQKQIDDLNDSQSAQDTLIIALQNAAVALEARVSTNEGDIGALELLVDIQGDLIITLQGNLSDLEGRVSTNEGDISALILADQAFTALIAAIEGNITSLTLLINANTSNVSILQGQVSNLESTLTILQSQISLKQNIISGICSEGSSIRQINTDGSVVCENDDISSGVGTLGTSTVNNTFRIPAVSGIFAGTLSLNATCPSGYKVTGGGYRINGYTDEDFELPGDPRLVFVQNNRVSSSSWNVTVINDNPVATIPLTTLTSGRMNLTTSAVCAKVAE